MANEQTNSTLAANAAAVDTSASTGTAQTTQTAAVAASTPCALEAGSKKHQELSKKLKSKNRQKAYERMEKIAAKNNGNYTFVDSNTGEKLTMPIADAKNYIETNNANGIPMYVNGAGTWGGHFLFQATGKPQEQQAVAQVDNTPATKDEGGFWNWCKRNWYWLLAGAGALAVGIVFLCRKKKKSTTYTAPDDPDKKPVDPGDKTPGGDNPGNDDPGNDNPGNSGNDIPNINDSDLNNGNGNGPSDGPSGDSGNTGGDSGNTGGDSGNTGGDSGNTGGDSGNTGGSDIPSVSEGPSEGAGSDYDWWNGSGDNENHGSYGSTLEDAGTRPNENNGDTVDWGNIFGNSNG